MNRVELTNLHRDLACVLPSLLLTIRNHYLLMEDQDMSTSYVYTLTNIHICMWAYIKYPRFYINVNKGCCLIFVFFYCLLFTSFFRLHWTESARQFISIKNLMQLVESFIWKFNSSSFRKGGCGGI